MNKEAILIIGCMERYRFYKQLSGHEVAELFAHYKLYEYIIPEKLSCDAAFNRLPFHNLI